MVLGLAGASDRSSRVCRPAKISDHESMYHHALQWRILSNMLWSHPAIFTLHLFAKHCLLVVVRCTSAARFGSKHIMFVYLLIMAITVALEKYYTSIMALFHHTYYSMNHSDLKLEL